MSYRQVLDDAIGQAPPSTIEIDNVVARQRRRMALRRAAGVGGSAVIVVALIAGFALARSGIRQSGRTVAGAGPAAAASLLGHLDRVLWSDLSTAAPGLLWLAGSGSSPRLENRPDSRDWSSEWSVDGAHGTYVGQGMVSSHGRIGTVLFNIDNANNGPSCPPVGSDGDKDGTCTIVTQADGTAIQTNVYHYARTDPPQIEIIVTAYRPDGLRVMAENRNQSGPLENDSATGVEPPLTVAELTRIVRDPSLTLPATWK